LRFAVCSAAPLEASGLDAWGADVGYGRTCFNASGPSIGRPIYYVSGRTDPLAVISLAAQQVAHVRSLYNLSDAQVRETKGDGYNEYAWERPASALPFTFVAHDYNITSPITSRIGIAGHCAPSHQNQLASYYVRVESSERLSQYFFLPRPLQARFFLTAWIVTYFPMQASLPDQIAAARRSSAAAARSLGQTEWWIGFVLTLASQSDQN
jgi:hypothetical protein